MVYSVIMRYMMRVHSIKVWYDMIGICMQLHTIHISMLVHQIIRITQYAHYIRLTDLGRGC